MAGTGIYCLAIVLNELGWSHTRLIAELRRQAAVDRGTVGSTPASPSALDPTTRAADPAPPSRLPRPRPRRAGQQRRAEPGRPSLSRTTRPRPVRRVAPSPQPGAGRDCSPPGQRRQHGHQPAGRPEVDRQHDHEASHSAIRVKQTCSMYGRRQSPPARQRSRRAAAARQVMNSASSRPPKITCSVVGSWRQWVAIAAADKTTSGPSDPR
jgi:hypothetical protein